MKKNKKIAPSLYSKIRKYQPGGFLSRDWVGRTLTGDKGFDAEMDNIDMPFGYEMNIGKGAPEGSIGYNAQTRNYVVPGEGGAGDAAADGIGGEAGGGGIGASMAGNLASSLVDDGSDMFYSGAEVAADAGRLLSGDLSAGVDIVKSVLGRGKARKEDRLQTTLIGDELTAMNRDETRKELERIGSTTTDMGNTMSTGEGSYGVRVKEGGMKYKQGDFKLGNVGRSNAYSGGGSGYLGSTFENVNVTEDEYNTLKNPGYNVGLYGGTKLHSKGTFADNPHNPDVQNQTTYMRGTKETVLPREQRLGINPLDQRGAQFADQIPDRIKYRSEAHATYLNDKQMMREQDKRRRFQQGLVDATEAGKEKKYLKNYNRDAKRFEKRGNTESGFRNLMRKIISPIIPKWGTEYANEDAKFEYEKGYKQGGMKLEGGSMMPIPGSDAVQFMGNRHSQGGIIDGDSEVERGETKDGVSSAKHGGMEMPYYFSDYVNVDGSKRYGGHSFADAHKKLLKEGGSQSEIDALAAAQDKAAGRNSKVAGYAQMGNFKNLSMPQDNTLVDSPVLLQSYSDRLSAFVDRDRSKPTTEAMLESVRGPGTEKENFAKNFRQAGDFTYYDTGASYFGPGESPYMYNMSDFNEDGSVINPLTGDTVDVIGSYDSDNPELGVNNNINTSNNTTISKGVNTSGNTTTYGDIINPYAKSDKLALAASMIAPIAAYTANTPQMQAVGDVTAVETPKLKYQKFDRERAINENDFQKVVQFVKTSGGGPADMINLMSAYERKMDANAGVTDREVKSRTTIDNMQAELGMKADTINVGNELSVKQLKQDANKFNVQTQADQQANKIGAIETAAANLVTANRDKKAFDATILMANAIDGGSGVLGRALSPEEQQQAIEDYMKSGKVLNSNQVNTQSNNNPGNADNAAQVIQTATGTNSDTAQEILASNDNMTLAKAFLGKNETDHTGLLTEIINNYAGTAKIDNPYKTAWCAGFTASVLGMNGYEHAGTASARSFANDKNSVPVAADDYQIGDVVVMWRDPKGKYDDMTSARERSDKANTGHVGFYAGTDENGNIIVLGGNQGSKGGGGVTEATFDPNRILAVRRYSHSASV